MAKHIVHLHSSEEDKVPGANQLSAGEIAVNNYAGKELLDLLKNINKTIIIVSKNIDEVLKSKYESKYENIKFDYRVAAIIENNNRFLLQKMKQDDAYTLVGGRVTLLTTSKESLIRELKEEINLNVTQKDLKLLEIAENFFDYKDENETLQKVHSVLFIYKVNITSLRSLYHALMLFCLGVVVYSH